MNNESIDNLPEIRALGRTLARLGDSPETLQDALKVIIALKDENAALTTQLEEAKGKLVMMSDALRALQGKHHPHCKAKHPEAHYLSCNCDELADIALEALSPDIKRYREEIEREAIQKCIKELQQVSLDEQHNQESPRGLWVPISCIEETLQSLLPNQKEVSDE